MSLVGRLYLLVILAMAPAIAILAYSEAQERYTRQERVEEDAQRYAQLISGELGRMIEGIRTLLVAVAHAPGVRAMDAAQCSRHVAELEPDFPNLTAITVFDLAGRPFCRGTPAAPGVRIDDRPYFKEALATGGFVTGEHTVARTTGIALLTFAVPFRDETGRTAGVVATGLQLDWLRQYFEGKQFPPQSSITIIDRTGTVLVRFPNPEFAGQRVPGAFGDIMLGAEAGGIFHSRAEETPDGVARIVGFTSLGDLPEGVIVAVGLPESWAAAGLGQARRRGFLLLALASAVVLAAAGAGGHLFIVRPIRRLLEATGRWRAGDLQARTNLGGHRSELGQLGRAFDGMAEELGRAMTALRESEARQRLALTAGRMGVWEWYFQDGIGHWDRMQYELCGVDPGEPTPVGEAFLRLAHADDREALRQAVQAVIDGRTDYAHEFRIVLPDGTSRWLAGRGMVIGEGRRRRMVGVNFDITAARQAQGQRELLLAELDHRIKNVLAVVSSVAALSLSGPRTLAEARGAFTERLQALGKTQDLLMGSPGRGAGLRSLVESELAPYGERARIGGEPVMLSAKAGQMLGMALHELATNAAKHGALSVAGGEVEVTWRIVGEAPEQRLCFSWRERGGPAVAPPAHSGFGRTLVERAVALDLNGAARLDFPSTGVRYELEVPLAKLVGP